MFKKHIKLQYNFYKFCKPDPVKDSMVGWLVVWARI